MNEKPNDGGPAFPCPVGHIECFHPPGMSLRDYFAAKAMAGICGNSGGAFQPNSISGWGLVNCVTEDLAKLAYQISDEMLKARESK
jgi:hypothetical protein